MTTYDEALNAITNSKNPKIAWGTQSKTYDHFYIDVPCFNPNKLFKLAELDKELIFDITLFKNSRHKDYPVIISFYEPFKKNQSKLFKKIKVEYSDIVNLMKDKTFRDIFNLLNNNILKEQLNEELTVNNLNTKKFKI